MKCVILEAGDLGGMPLVECGGAMLKRGDRIVVSKSMLASLKSQYGSKFKEISEIEKESLKQGRYELVVHTGSAPVAELDNGKAVVDAARVLSPAMPEPELATPSSDKSMQKKQRARRR
jgi:hypothetical protein